MADGCAGCRAEVEHLAARLDVDVLYTAQDGRRQLGAERVPSAVLYLLLILLSKENVLKPTRIKGKENVS